MPWLVSAPGAAVGAVFFRLGLLVCPPPQPPPPPPRKLPRASLGDLPAFGPTCSVLLAPEKGVLGPSSEGAAPPALLWEAQEGITHPTPQPGPYRWCWAGDLAPGRGGPGEEGRDTLRGARSRAGRG